MVAEGGGRGGVPCVSAETSLCIPAERTGRRRPQPSPGRIHLFKLQVKKGRKVFWVLCARIVALRVE